MLAGEPLAGPAGHRAANRRKVQSVCAKQQAVRSGEASEAMPFPCAPGLSPEARLNRAAGPIDQARIVTRMGGDKAAALAP